MPMYIFRKQFFKDTLTILKDAGVGFMEDKGLKLSASLAYYTTFSLAPMLLLIISLAGAIWGQEAIEGKVFSEINGLIGDKAANQVQEIITNLRLSGETTLSLIIGAVTLVIGATTVFGEIQDSINIIWRLRAKPKRGWLKLLKDRLRSGSIIVGLGFLLIVMLIINGLVSTLGDMLQGYFPHVTVVIMQIVSFAISFVIISVLFGVIFRVLPDAEIGWKDVKAGALFTAVLFMLGRYLIGLYIETTGAGSPYGAAGSIIIILLWVYFTAAILYFGAEFTRAYANFTGVKIRPSSVAVYIETTEVEKKVDSIPLENRCVTNPVSGEEECDDDKKTK